MLPRLGCLGLLFFLSVVILSGCGDGLPTPSNSQVGPPTTPSIQGSTAVVLPPITPTTIDPLSFGQEDSSLTPEKPTPTSDPPQIISPENAARLSILHHIELPHGTGLNRIVFVSDGDMIAQADRDNGTQLWSSVGGSDGGVVFGPLRSYQSVRTLLAPDARSVTVADPKGKVWILHVPSGAISETIQFPKPDESWERFPVPIAVSPDNQLLVTQSADAYKIRVWRMDTGKLVYLLVHNTGERGGVDTALFSPDGKTLATASHDGIVWLWRAKDGSEMQKWQTPLQEWDLPRLAFSPKGNLLATATTRRGVLMFWSIDSGDSRVLSSGQQGQIFNLAFSPDGRLLAASGDGDTVYLWNVETGSLVGSFTPSGWLRPSSVVTALAFSPDGKMLAVGLETTKMGDTTPDSVDLWTFR